MLEFIARSEWPLVVAGTLWLLRQPLQRMIDRATPTKIDAWGLRAEFQKGLNKVDHLAPQTRAKRLESTQSEDDPADVGTSRVGHLGPNVTSDILVLEAWEDLEGVIRELSAKLPASSQYPAHELDQVAHDLGLTSDEVSALLELRSLRNQVARTINAPITDFDARRFQMATHRLLTRLVERAESNDNIGHKE